MSCVSRPAVALLLALAFLPGPARAEERKPSQKPAHSRRQVDRLEALTLYGLAVRYEKQNRLLEATRTYEKALQLDPESAEIRKALVPLYMALDRQEDALAACKKALEIDDRDFTTWYLHARQLQALDRPKEARQALIRAASCPGLADRPEAQLSILHDLGELHEKFGDLGKAEAAFRQVAAILEKPGMSLRPSGSGDEVPEQVAELLERVGRLCLKQNQPARAIAAFEQARKKDSNRAVRLAFHLADRVVVDTAAHLRRFRPTFVVARQTRPAPFEVIAAAEKGDRLREVRYLLTREADLYGLDRLKDLPLLHAHFGPDGVYALPIAERLGVPLVVTFHGFETVASRLSLWLSRELPNYQFLLHEGELKRRGALFIAVSEFIRERLIARGYPAERVVRHYIGVDTEKFSPLKGHARDERYVLSVGRHTRRKGIDTLLFAFARIARHHPAVTLVQVGAGPLTAQLTALAEQARDDLGDTLTQRKGRNVRAAGTVAQ